MIYFIKDTVTLAVTIGYSKDAKKRLAHLQTATPHQLSLLGAIQGGLEHEAAYHERFATYRLQGEWFKGDVLPEVLGIIPKDAVGLLSLQRLRPDDFWHGTCFPPMAR
jgi:hypothetical protein